MAERGASLDRPSGVPSRRGSSFVEVLLAMTIMALVLVGILQMFSVSLIINKGAAARTQMLFKCEQVVENIRWYYYVTSNSLAAPTNTGIPPLAAGTVNLPYVSTDAGWDFWGPNGANVMERDDGGPYKISYTLVKDDGITTPPPGQTLNSGVNVWVITVSAVPTDVPGGGGLSRYLGIGTNGGGKRVDYVAQFTQ
jgi:Tfp pilus assembly protein PilV